METNKKKNYRINIIN
uniref:Uncharacterized protein n=1 Tax=Anguilla anguilla TaxID=7936 RepID=A0A0E9UWR4_ANGAN